MSAGSEHCKFTHGGLGFKCNHCDDSGGPYKNAVIAKRMASNHAVKSHRDIVKPALANANVATAPAKQRKQKPAIGVNFCPCCGTNLHAIRVALSL